MREKSKYYQGCAYSRVKCSLSGSKDNEGPEERDGVSLQEVAPGQAGESAFSHLPLPPQSIHYIFFPTRNQTSSFPRPSQDNPDSTWPISPIHLEVPCPLVRTWAAGSQSSSASQHPGQPECPHGHPHILTCRLFSFLTSINFLSTSATFILPGTAPIKFKIPVFPSRSTTSFLSLYKTWSPFTEISPVLPSCLAHSAIGWSASFGQGSLPAVSSFLTRLPPPSTCPGLATSFILAGTLDSHTPSPCLSQP